MEYLFMFFFFWIFVGGIMSLFQPFSNAVLFGFGSAVGQILFQLAKNHFKF